MPNEESVEGYCVPLSVEPGESIALHVGATRRLRQGAAEPASTELRFDIEIVRIGATRELVRRFESQIAHPLPIPPEAFARGAGYPEALSFIAEKNWRSGFYEVRLSTHRNGGARTERSACFIVRPSRAVPQDKPLLVLATNTWNAYNDWGGRNLYTGATHVSFLRPFAHGLVDRPDPVRNRISNRHREPDLPMRNFADYVRSHGLCSWCGASGFSAFEAPFVAWAERAGFILDYAISADLETHPELLENRRLYLSVGHDEYWSSGMRDNVEGYVAGGGNAMFLSGNTCFWQVRTDDAGATMVCYKGRAREEDPLRKDAPRLLTSMWSDPRIGRPETQLTGLSFTRGGYHRIAGGVPRGAGGYTMWRPQHWLFQGTNLRYGDLLGAEHGVVGYECDGCAFTLEDGLPVPTGEDGCPAGFEILASTPARIWSVDADGNEYPSALAATRASGELQSVAFTLFGDASAETCRRLAHGNAVLGTYTSGGTVVSCGCTDWVFGLAGGDVLIERITSNALERLSRQRPV